MSWRYEILCLEKGMRLEDKTISRPCNRPWNSKSSLQNLHNKICFEASYVDNTKSSDFTLPITCYVVRLLKVWSSFAGGYAFGNLLMICMKFFKQNFTRPMSHRPLGIHRAFISNRTVSNLSNWLTIVNTTLNLLDLPSVWSNQYPFQLLGTKSL